MRMARKGANVGPKIAAPINETLLAPPPQSVRLISSSRNGNGSGGIGGFETSANAFIVYASTDQRDSLVAWYRTLAASDYRYDIQNHGDTIEITAFAKNDASRHANVTLTSDLPSDIIRAYTSASTHTVPLATAPTGTKTYIAVVAGRG